MFGQAGPTAFDLQFSLFGIPVRVHPAFWLVAALLGWQPGRLDLVLIWIGCVFVSILVHELGHALTAKHYGWPPEITLFHFGGLASFRPTWGYTTGRAILISFAGPGAGFLLFGLLKGLETWMVATGRTPGPMGQYALLQLEFINLFWGLINLLPVLPLDGGQISRDICLHLRPRDGMQWALKIAMLVSGGMAFFLLSNGLPFAGILFGILCFENFQSYQGLRGGFW